MTDGLRDRKKEATRQAISNVATRLFIKKGFDQVSVADIATEAQVARKTVFNYFPRKEDLVFDREQETRDLVREALESRGKQSPIAAFQALTRMLLESDHPLFRMSERPVRFWRMVAQSPVLTARARELQVTLADDLANMLADAAEQPRGDPHARLAASMLMGTLVVAYQEALRAFREKREPSVVFRSVIDRGFVGVDNTLTGTRYVSMKV